MNNQEAKNERVQINANPQYLSCTFPRRSQPRLPPFATSMAVVVMLVPFPQARLVQNPFVIPLVGSGLALR